MTRSPPAAALLVLLAAVAPAQDNEECLECHGVDGLELEQNGRTRSLFVDEERFDESVHGGMDCVLCHMDLDGVEEYPHPRDLEPVDCTACHDDDDGPIAVFRASIHGRLVEEEDELAPRCQDCHGSHYVVRRSDPASPLAPLRVTATCTQCHVEGAGVERVHDLSPRELRARYVDRLHERGVERGVTVTAVCTSCHGGHDVLPATDPASSIHADNVNGTCLACHVGASEVHRDVIAPEAWEREQPPRCVDCHAPHAHPRVRYDDGIADADCLACHAAGAEEPGERESTRAPLVDPARYELSIHARRGVACARCHTGVVPTPDERPCAPLGEPVRCDTCHAGAVEAYGEGVHGKLAAEDDENAPGCTDCHGVHDVLEHELPADAPAAVRDAVRRGPTFVHNVPALCGRCHRDGAAAAVRYLGPQDHVLERYRMSIHGKGLLESGLTVTAVCTDCHTAHRELPADDPASTVHESNVASTCGQCHDGIYEVFETSIHSKAGNPGYEQLRDMPPLPSCADCHSSHGVARTELPAFQLGIMQQCGACHEEITRTYFETYHGKASALGDTARAKCYDCHGAHDVRSMADPRSRLHPARIVETCAQCHPGSHAQFATYLTHANHHDRERYPALFYAFWGMTSLLVGVFVFFGLHTAIWLPRSWKLYKQHRLELASIPTEEKQYLRFSRFSRGLHLTVILSFFGLAITGMMLKFSDAFWARALARAIGGIDAAGFIHRVCAVATFGYMALHLWDVGRRFRRSEKGLWAFLFGPDSLLPRFSDVRDFVATMKWFVGRGPMPAYGRWTYWEKFDYFAVFWGVVIIGISGLVLWFPVLVTKVLPGWAINVATIIHSDEALLAVGFIFTIHFFNTHLRPEKFPMDPVIFTGRMRLKELRLERPAHYEKLRESGELEARLVDPAPPHFAHVARVFGYTALFVGVTLIVLIVWSLIGSLVP